MAIQQERRKYDKLGWNILYDFNELDFELSLDMVCKFLTRSDADNIPWKVLAYLIGQV